MDKLNTSYWLTVSLQNFTTKNVERKGTTCKNLFSQGPTCKNDRLIYGSILAPRPKSKLVGTWSVPSLRWMGRLAPTTRPHIKQPGCRSSSRHQNGCKPIYILRLIHSSLVRCSGSLRCSLSSLRRARSPRNFPDPWEILLWSRPQSLPISNSLLI